MTLALFGGQPAIRTTIRRANTIGLDEADAAWAVICNSPLSGYLAGKPRGGPFVTALEDLWAKKFGVRYAVACNSATSGLLASCAAVGVKCKTKVIVPCFTMSATAAAPDVLGADLWFADVEQDYYCVRPETWPAAATVIVTNLFGHPAHLKLIRDVCNKVGCYLIEDNAQAIMAKENGAYTGTIGDIGVFSLNVHKSIHAGEGGICCTNDDRLADNLRGFVNHGENAGLRSGLNLRMTEYQAAIAIEQFSKLDQITDKRIKQAEALSNSTVGSAAWVAYPHVRPGCTHVYYCWVLRLLDSGIDRQKLVAAFNSEGFPLRAGYVDPLYRLQAFAQSYRRCPYAEFLHDKSLMLFENTMFDLDDTQIGQFGEALKKIEQDIDKLRVET